MNINNLSRQKLLEEAVLFVKVRIQGWVLTKTYVDGKVIYAKLNKDSLPVIGVKVSEKIDIGVYTKHLEFIVVNDRLVPSIPKSALCDLGA